MKGLTRLLLAALLCAPGLAGAAVPAATVTLLTGHGTATGADGAVRTLAQGDPVYSGEIIHSGFNSYLDLKFSDGGFFLLRPSTRFQINNYVDAAAPAEAPPTAAAAQSAAPAPQPVSPPAQGAASHAFFSLLKGGFRTVSGLIGKINHEDYSVATPVATIGIRGTDYLTVLCDATCATDPEINALLPPGLSALGGEVTTVYAHSIVVTTAKDTILLQEGQYLLTLPDGTDILLPEEPHFLHVDPTPDPAACSGGD
jgi:hypothetical protein